MPVTSFVDIGTLPQANSGTVDLTSSGFGTVGAAVIFLNAANTTNNPQADAVPGIGFWDGTNDSSVSVFSEDGLTTSNAERYMSTTNLRYGVSALNYDVSAVTDGIRLTKTSGTTTVDRYVSAVCFGGLTNAASGTLGLGTGTTAVSVTGLGFKPDMVFIISHCDSTQDSTVTNWCLSFGVAHNSSTDTVTQGCITSGSNDGRSTTRVNSVVSNTAACGQVLANNYAWRGVVSNFVNGGFDITPSASAGNDEIMYLAVEFPNPDDGYVGTFAASTSTGNVDYTGFGFDPESCGAMCENTTSFNSASETNSIMMSISDGTTTSCEFYHDEDNVTTGNANSEHSTNFLNGQDDAGTTDFVATMNAFITDGIRLNYSDAASSGKQVILWAVGDSDPGGGPTVRPPKLHNIKNQFNPIIAARLGGVLE